MILSDLSIRVSVFIGSAEEACQRAGGHQECDETHRDCGDQSIHSYTSHAAV